MSKTNRRSDEDKFRKKSKKNQTKKQKKSNFKQQLRHIKSADDWSDDYEDFEE